MTYNMTVLVEVLDRGENFKIVEYKKRTSENPSMTQTSVSPSPPREMAFRMASSTSSDSRKAVMVRGTVPWQDSSDLWVGSFTSPL